MLRCRRCRKVKEDSEFRDEKSNIYRKKSSWCEWCFIKYQQEYTHDIWGLIKRIYTNQKKSSKGRGHQPPEYTKGALARFLYTETKFIYLFEQWELSEWEPGLIPSVDRKDDKIGYTLDNIQVMTWDENRQKEQDLRKSGQKTINSEDIGIKRAVLQLDFNGNVIAEFESLTEAKKQTGISCGMCVNGIYSQAGGYRWEFKQNHGLQTK